MFLLSQKMNMQIAGRQKYPIFQFNLMAHNPLLNKRLKDLPFKLKNGTCFAL